MNKEIIYIEPSDDITDILSKLKSSDKKVVALVPPKKPTVLLSSVNIKLIARTAKAGHKAVVLVSTDDSLTKLAMAANLPVAPSLKSRPTLPGEEVPKPAEKPAEETVPTEEAEETEKSEEPEAEADADESDADDSDSSKETKEAEEVEETEEAEETTEASDDESEEAKPKKKKSAEADETEESESSASKKSAKKAKKEKSDATGFKGWIIDHKAWVIFGAIAAVFITVFLIWAFTIAPKVKVKISVRTSSANFSENVNFTTQPADEKAESGIFYLREEKLEKDQAVKFTATGKKDMGDAAAGQLVLTAYFLEPGSIAIQSGAKFSHGGFDYYAVESTTIAGPAKRTASAFKASCDNYSDDDFQIGIDYCQVSIVIAIKAAAPGEDYNLAATEEGWSSSISGVGAYNRTDITGGTSRIVTVVQQSDIDLALEKLKNENADNGKNELYGKLSDTVMPIESSYEISTTEPKSTPAVGEEVADGVTPQLASKTTYTVLTVDRVRIEEFIKQKANVEEGKRFYSVGEPFVEYFAKNGDGTYSAKLKTTYKVGPEISETEVLEKIQGEKIGRIEPVLKDSFVGISSVSIEKSFFWVNAVPNDPNKVQIELTIEE